MSEPRKSICESTLNWVNHLETKLPELASKDPRQVAPIDVELVSGIIKEQAAIGRIKDLAISCRPEEAVGVSARQARPQNYNPLHRSPQARAVAAEKKVNSMGSGYKWLDVMYDISYNNRFPTTSIAGRITKILRADFKRIRNKGHALGLFIQVENMTAAFEVEHWVVLNSSRENAIFLRKYLQNNLPTLETHRVPHLSQYKGDAHNFMLYMNTESVEQALMMNMEAKRKDDGPPMRAMPPGYWWN